MGFMGFDHVDTRVASLDAVEPFYDELMPKLGLPNKRFAYVDERGDWHDASAERPYNTVEYIEERAMRPVATRLAFRVDRASLTEWIGVLTTIGARNVEPSADLVTYPAIFFEDAAGTRLELCGR